MIELNIPGRGVIQIDHLVSDVNGTLAVDGQLMEGVASALLRLSDRLQIHLLTADTHGRQAAIDQQLGLQAVRIPAGGEAEANADTPDCAVPDTVDYLVQPTGTHRKRRMRKATMLRLVSVFRRGWVTILVSLIRHDPLPLGRFIPEPWPMLPYKSLQDKGLQVAA